MSELGCLCGFVAAPRAALDRQVLRNPGLTANRMNRSAGLVDLIGRDVQMGYHPDRGWTERHHTHTASFQLIGKLLGRAPSFVDVEDQDVRLRLTSRDFEKIETACGRCQPFGMLVVYFQSIDVMIQRVQCSCRNNSNLTHPTPKKFSRPSSPGNELLGSS